jgi:hypothetical protein
LNYTQKIKECSELAKVLKNEINWFNQSI